VRSYLGGVVSRKPSSMHGAHVDLEVAHRGGHHLHERPLGVKHLPQCWRGRHRQPGLRRPAHPPALHHRPHVSERAGHAPTMAVTLPGGRRSVEGERTGHADGASAVLPGPCCVRATAHVSCRLAPGRGETLEGVSPSPSPPWGSTWAISCVHATARPSVQRSPGAGVTADAQLSVRRGGA
jgi:hypothetical protein